MTPDEIKRRVANIAYKCHNPQFAKHLEEFLWFETLTAIAEGKAEDPVECAKAAVSTKELWPNWHGREFPTAP